MADTFASLPPEHMIHPANGAYDAFAAKSDTVDLTIEARAFYTGSGGDIKITTHDKQDVSLVGVPAGTIFPIRMRRLWSTGTTATDVVGLY